MPLQGVQHAEEEASIENPVTQAAESDVPQGSKNAASAAMCLDQLCLLSLVSEENKLTAEAKVALQMWAETHTQEELSSDSHRDAMGSVAKGVAATFSEAAPNW